MKLRKPEMKARLAKLEREDTEAFTALVQAYLADGAAAFGYRKRSGRDSRPGDVLLWAEVRAIMEARNVGHPSACSILADRNSRREPNAFSLGEGRPMKAWRPIIDATTLARYYREADRRYKSFDRDVQDAWNFWRLKAKDAEAQRTK